ncbi:hypothetical protein FHG87_001178 [Trinorchestia longiramus]|nr:hypothetical protein FHG87_001178 [Trinorchestia longiramus]
MEDQPTIVWRRRRLLSPESEASGPSSTLCDCKRKSFKPSIRKHMGPCKQRLYFDSILLIRRKLKADSYLILNECNSGTQQALTLTLTVLLIWNLRVQKEWRFHSLCVLAARP